MIAVDFDRDPPSFDEQNKMWNPDGVLEICGSLVRIDVGRNMAPALATAHASVLEFLQTKPIRIGSEPEIYFTRSSVNLRMAETCLVYLRYFFDNHIELSGENLNKYPFARYCANFWHEHYRACVAHGQKALTMTRLNGLVMNLFQTPDLLLQWIRLYDPESDPRFCNFSKRLADIQSPLHYASILGLSGIAQNLIDQGAKINDPSRNGFRTPLIAAIVSGRVDTVSLLLDRGADPNCFGWWYQSSQLRWWRWGCPLAAAVETNQAEIVKILLGRKEIDINCRRMLLSSELEDIRKDVADWTLSAATIERNSKEGMVYIAATHNSSKALKVLVGWLRCR